MSCGRGAGGAVFEGVADDGGDEVGADESHVWLSSGVCRGIVNGYS
jgi:hypothetical protein